MKRFKYILIIFIFLGISESASAFDIEYGNILGIKGSSVLLNYFGVNVEHNFLCNIVTRACSPTKKTILGVPASKNIPKELKQELDEKKASHITLSPKEVFLSYSIFPTAENKNRIFVIKNLATKEEYSMASPVLYWDLTDEQPRVFEFSPDGNTLAHLDDREGVLALYKVDLTTLANGTFTSTKLSTTAFSIMDFVWSDKDTIYYIGNSKDNPYLWSLYRYNLSTGKDVIVESNVSYVDPIRKVGQNLLFNHLQKNGYGPEIYNTKTKKIAQFKIPNINQKKNIVKQEVVKIGAMSAVLMTPSKIDTSKTYPLIIWLHGGPLRQSSYGYHPYHSYGIYDGILELLRKNNVYILKLDYRGSYGFDRAYAEGIKNNVGKGDVEDVMEALAHMRTNYKTNEVYLVGNSYGGYMSLRTLVEHPDSFTGAFSINGVTDWESLIVSMRTSIFNTHFDGLPNESNRALYDQASILSRIGNLGNQKIKIVAGVADRTIPHWQATLLYDKLKAENKNVGLISYPGEDHVFKKKKTITNLCVELFNFVGIKPDSGCKS